MTALACNDYEVATGCIGVAVQGIINRGRDFRSLGLWQKRAGQLLNSATLSLLARAFLFLHLGWAEIMGAGNLGYAEKQFAALEKAAQQAESSSLLLLRAALEANISFWRADLAALEIMLADVEPLIENPQAAPLAVLLFLSSSALLKTLQGHAEDADKMFSSLLANPLLADLPPAVCLQIQGNSLYTAAMLSDLRKVEKISEIMRRSTVSTFNHYYHSYFHFNLAFASLALERPYKALLHARQCRRCGQRCQSANVAKMSAFVVGQALAGLGRYEEALTHFRIWQTRWQQSGYTIIATWGAMEMSRIFVKLGKIDQARTVWLQAQEMIPKNEKLPVLFRSRQQDDHFRTLLFPPSGHPVAHEKALTITTLGSFSVTRQEGSVIYDRDWHGNRAKDLLMAIIALGGSKIPTERIAYLLWPDANGDQAMNAFKVTLFRLRRVLAGNISGLRGVLVVKQKQVSLSRAFCDVDALLLPERVQEASRPNLQPEAMATALALYGGNFLESVSDFWIINAREELRDCFVQATLELCNNYRKYHRLDSAAALLLRAMRFDPFNEILYARLMEVYLLQGNHAKALDIYQRALTVIDQTLGLKPGSELVTAYRLIPRS